MYIFIKYKSNWMKSAYNFVIECRIGWLNCGQCQTWNISFDYFNDTIFQRIFRRVVNGVTVYYLYSMLSTERICFCRYFFPPNTILNTEFVFTLDQNFWYCRAPYYRPAWIGAYISKWHKPNVYLLSTHHCYISLRRKYGNHLNIYRCCIIYSFLFV